MDRSSQTFARTLCSSAPSAKNILISFLNSILKTDRITDVDYDSFGRIKQIFSVENYCF